MIPKPLNDLWHFLASSRKFQFIPVLLVLLLSGVAEAASLAAFAPFLTFLQNPNQYAPPIAFFRLGDSSLINGVFYTGGFFVAAICIAAALRLANQWINGRYVAAVSCDLGIAIYDSLLSRSYEYHSKRNSSDCIASIASFSGASSAVVSAVLQILSSLASFVLVLAVMLSASPIVTTCSVSILFAGYLFVAHISRSRIRRSSDLIVSGSKQEFRLLTEGFGAIRDVILSGNRPAYVRKYADNLYRLKIAGVTIGFLASYPRVLLEVLVFASVISSSVFYLLSGQPPARLVDAIGLFALGSQKLMPLTQSIYSGWASLNSQKSPLEAALVELQENSLDGTALSDEDSFGRADQRIPFDKISLHNVSFRYAQQERKVLNSASMTVYRGQRVGFIGATGSGKSTLLDLLMGLIFPESGYLSINGNRLSSLQDIAYWRSCISHVPQSIFLSDSSIAENIAFSDVSGNLDYNRIALAAKAACLDEFVQSMPAGYQTEVGERGVRLSGGQRQRLGIARALYSQSELLVLDEATSALDNATEARVMQNIYGLRSDLTIFMIAHRLSTLSGCDRIFRVSSDGGLAEVDKSEVFI